MGMKEKEVGVVSDCNTVSRKVTWFVAVVTSADTLVGWVSLWGFLELGCIPLHPVLAPLPLVVPIWWGASPGEVHRDCRVVHPSGCIRGVEVWCGGLVGPGEWLEGCSQVRVIL
jgi:hypothetical protein